MKALDLFELEFEAGIVLELAQERLELVPAGLFRFDKSLEVDDHSTCLCLTSRYLANQFTGQYFIRQHPEFHATQLERFLDFAQPLPGHVARK